MLDHRSGSDPVNDASRVMLDLVRLPDEWVDYYVKRGVLPGTYDERRRFPRYYYRGRAMLHSGDKQYVIYTKDLSRCGIGFYHYKQLFPGDAAVLWLPPDTRLAVGVTRCNRVSENCYECGAEFVAKADQDAAVQHLAGVISDDGDAD